jgi:amino acid adenylation domain-containing protein
VTVLELVKRVRQQGVTLWVENGRLRYRAPKGVLTASLRAQLLAHKAEIVDLLQASRHAAALEPLKRVPRDGVLRLSSIQERLWYLEQLDPDNPAYNIAMAWRLEGPLNLVALEKSLDAIVHRHEVLRMACITHDGQPGLTLAPELQTILTTVDLRNHLDDSKESHALDLATREARRPFDLTQTPLLRASVFWLDVERHTLLLVTHHFVADGWSMGILLQELSLLYESLATGRPTPLAELPVQYVDLAQWERQQLTTGAFETQLAYWKRQLRGAPALLDLPADHPRPRVWSYCGATHSFALGPRLTEALRDLSRREGSTLFLTLLTAFQILLYRYTGQDDMIVGTAVSNRNRQEAENLLGSFANTLVLRTDLYGNPTFRELLDRVRQVTWEAFAHQDLPFEKLVNALQPERNTGAHPLHQVAFLLHHRPGELRLRLAGLAAQRVPIELGTARLDLFLEMSDLGQELAGVLEYSTDLFDATTIARMTGHFQTLLEGITTDPDRHLGDLPLLTDEERHQLLVQWNATQADYPEDLCLHQLFEAQVERTPDAIAVVFEDRQLTYRALNGRANQLAHYLQKLGVGPEVLVGLHVERSLEMVVAVLGILKAGGAYLPLDPAYPAPWIDRMLQDAETPVLLTQQHLRPEPSRHGAQVVCLDADWPAISAESAESPSNHTDPRNAAYVIFTSGSTGRPKGVVVEHRSVLNLLTGLQRTIYADASRQAHPLCISLNGPLTFDTSVKELFQALNGHTLRILPSEIRADGEALLAYLRRHELDVFDCTPSQLESLLAAGMLQKQGPMPELALVGGEAIAQSTWQTVAQADEITFYNLYGPTECTVDATIAQIGPEDSRPTIGRPMANTQVYLLDPQLEPVPVGVRGELCIGGLGVSRGYLHRPALTAERFIPDPFGGEPGARLYRTGDLVRYLPDGKIEFLGREDHQVKIRGFRVELGGIETTLSQHPGVRDAAAMVREDTPAGRRLVAYLVPAQAETGPKTGELRRYLKKELPDHMVPSAFVSLGALPLMPSGKVDRQALPAPDRTRPDLEEPFVAPRTAVESLLAEVWQEVLGVDRIGVYDNFFDLGGHSLLSVQAIARVEKRLGIRINPIGMIGQTLGQLAALYEQRMHRPEPAERIGLGEKLKSAIRSLV